MFGALATVALITWALLELFKGDSYIRRVLGAIVLSGIIVSYLR